VSGSDQEKRLAGHPPSQRGHLTRIIGENIHILSLKVKEAIANRLTAVPPGKPFDQAAKWMKSRV